jgi:hypothetical protein
MKHKSIVVGVVCLGLVAALAGGGIWLLGAASRARDSAVAYSEQFMTAAAPGWEFNAARPYITDRCAQSCTPSKFEEELAPLQHLGAFRSFELTTWQIGASTGGRPRHAMRAIIEGNGVFENGRKRVRLELIDAGEGWRVDKFLFDQNS